MPVADKRKLFVVGRYILITVLFYIFFHDLRYTSLRHFSSWFSDNVRNSIETGRIIPAYYLGIGSTCYLYVTMSRHLIFNEISNFALKIELTMITKYGINWNRIEVEILRSRPPLRNVMPSTNIWKTYVGKSANAPSAVMGFFVI